MFLNDDDSHYYGQQAQSQEKLLLKCFLHWLDMVKFLITLGEW